MAPLNMLPASLRKCYIRMLGDYFFVQAGNELVSMGLMSC